MEKTANAGMTKNVLFISAVSIVLVALNLRPSMASFGPLLNQIVKSIDISYTQISLLTMLPVIAMGLGMFLGSRIKLLIGLVPGVFFALFLIGFSTVARLFYFEVFGRITTAIISGFGIAIIQALMPAFIKSNFKNVPLLMGIYSTAIMGGATISASLSPWLANKFDSWQQSLAIWSMLAILGLIAWTVVSHLTKKQPTGQSRVVAKKDHFFTNRRAWLLAIFFGLGTSY